MDFIALSKFAELWAPEIKSVPISKKGTPLISFSLATEIYELTSSIFFKLKKLLIKNYGFEDEKGGFVDQGKHL